MNSMKLRALLLVFLIVGLGAGNAKADDPISSSADPWWCGMVGSGFVQLPSGIFTGPGCSIAGGGSLPNGTVQASGDWMCSVVVDGAYVQISEGAHSAGILCEDPTLGSYSRSVNYITDWTPPALTVSHDIEDQLFGRSSTITVTGTVSDASAGVADIRTWMITPGERIVSNPPASWHIDLHGWDLVGSTESLGVVYSSVTFSARDLVGNLITFGTTTTKNTDPSLQLVLKLDVEAPVIAILTPTGSNISDLSSIAGTASDNSGRPVMDVTVSVLDVTTGKYWNGSDFVSNASVDLPASGGNSWSFEGPSADYVVGGHDYGIVVKAVDEFGNESWQSVVVGVASGGIADAGVCLNVNDDPAVSFRPANGGAFTMTYARGDIFKLCATVESHVDVNSVVFESPKPKDAFIVVDADGHPTNKGTFEPGICPGANSLTVRVKSSVKVCLGTGLVQAKKEKEMSPGKKVATCLLGSIEGAVLVPTTKTARPFSRDLGWDSPDQCIAQSDDGKSVFPLARPCRLDVWHLEFQGPPGMILRYNDEQQTPFLWKEFLSGYRQIPRSGGGHLPLCGKPPSSDSGRLMFDGAYFREDYMGFTGIVPAGVQECGFEVDQHVKIGTCRFPRDGNKLTHLKVRYQGFPKDINPRDQVGHVFTERTGDE